MIRSHYCAEASLPEPLKEKDLFQSVWEAAKDSHFLELQILHLKKIRKFLCKVT